MYVIEALLSSNMRESLSKYDDVFVAGIEVTDEECKGCITDFVELALCFKNIRTALYLSEFLNKIATTDDVQEFRICEYNPNFKSVKPMY